MGICAPSIIVDPGEWADWPTTLTGLTKGAGGLVLARWVQIGNTVVLKFRFTWGSGSSITGTPTFTLPTPVADPTLWHQGLANFRDVSASAEFGGVIQTDTSGLTARIVPQTVSGALIAYANPTNTSPFTWASGDFMAGTLFYEAA